ncbi:hypothetical protein [Actinoplanes sp. DH11]|uniref:hypothetical protein n=1 Tax=Actinoplanes sp. DH11 TaxID=2857011 RepID=UPI001E292163|nr:hypothetical protein [Actinoplanes sp. DH11]
MTFHVEPLVLRAYARQLGDIDQVAEEADRYISVYGDLALHEQGLMGFVAPGHRVLVAEFHRLMAHLKNLGIESERAVGAAAAEYERTDTRSAAEIDAGYPGVPRGGSWDYETEPRRGMGHARSD